MESEWLTHAKRLQAIASTGLNFARDPYDVERYDEVGRIANTMIARLGSVPIDRIANLVSDFAQGYATPKVDVRAAVIENGQVLLVRERLDGFWKLPGGFADVGLSAAENVIKEVQEEAGISVAARRLYAVRHKAKQPYEADARDFYKMFFLCDRLESAEPKSGSETIDVGFFPPDALPPLSLGRVLATDIAVAFRFHETADLVTVFD